MALYFKDTEITNIDNLVPQTGLDITDIWFGNTNVYTVWQVYEGILPITLNANGADMRQYQIYGASGGVGEPTENLFNYRDCVAGYYISSSGVETEASHDSYFRATWLNHSDYISVSPDESYTISAHHQNMNTQQTVAIAWYDESKIFILRDSTMIPKKNTGSYSFTATAPQNAKFAIFNFFTDDVQKVMFTPGTTPPEAYVPDGHKLSMVVFDEYQIYDDTLPAQISTNRMNFKNYKIFGAVGGVGDRTVQLFTAVIEQGSFITTSGQEYNSETRIRSKFEGNPLTAGTYTIDASGVDDVVVYVYDIDKQYIQSASIIEWQEIPFTFTISANVYVRFAFKYSDDSNITPANISNIMLTPGTTPPEAYVPDGYKLDMGASSSNVMPSAPAETKTSNGITVTCDGEGRYSISGTATANTYITFDIPEFTIPISAEKGGNGTFSMFNTSSNPNVSLRFLYNDATVDEWVLNPTNRISTTYVTMGGRTVNGLKFFVPSSNTFVGTVSPMFTNNGVLPNKYQPYSNTVTPIYIGSDPLGKDEYIDYQAGKVYRRTENLLNYHEIDYEHIWDNSGQKAPPTGNNNFASPMIAVVPGETYLRTYNLNPTGNVFFTYDAQKNFLSRESAGNNLPFTVGQNVAYITYNIPVKDDRLPELYMLTLGSTAPSTHIPYFQPTDPPVPLPALSTVEGETIVDYAGQSTVPSRFYGKYINSPILPIYIGSGSLNKDEYVDYEEGKIYRRTAQLFNKNTATIGSYIDLNGEVRNAKYCCSDFIPVSAGSYYLKNVIGQTVQNTTVVYDANKRALRYANISGSYATKGVITFTDSDAYIRVNVNSSTNLDTVDIIVGSTEPTEHIPYIAPVNPPAPLPVFPTCEGTTIVDYAGQSVAIPEKVAFKYRKKNF